MEGVIAPKPTTYRDIQFRSRLEARWAVLLDWYQFVQHWLYEPQHYKYDMTKFGGDHWLPDFFFATGYMKGLLEIKPSMPSEDYLTMLGYATEQLKLPIYVGFCSFYNEVPRVMKIDPNHPHKDTSVPIDTFAEFPRINSAVSIAAHYRFDLANQPTPPWRQPVRGEYDYHLNRWTAEERRRNRVKTKH